MRLSRNEWILYIMEKVWMSIKERNSRQIQVEEFSWPGSFSVPSGKREGAN